MVPFFFFNDTATTEISTLSLHDALPILQASNGTSTAISRGDRSASFSFTLLNEKLSDLSPRSEEPTTELPSPCNRVSPLLLETKAPPRPRLTPQRHPC